MDNSEYLSESCLKSCRGLYADIKHLTEDGTVTISKGSQITETIFEEYLNYKRGLEKNYLEYYANFMQGIFWNYILI